MLGKRQRWLQKGGIQSITVETLTEIHSITMFNKRHNWQDNKWQFNKLRLYFVKLTCIFYCLRHAINHVFSVIGTNIFSSIVTGNIHLLHYSAVFSNKFVLLGYTYVLLLMKILQHLDVLHLFMC